MNPRRPRQENEAHRKYIGTLPCLLCPDDTGTECAHIRYADPAVAKRFTGLGEKSDDRFTVPLCNSHHRLQHTHGNEREFWQSRGVDPVKVALALFSVSGDHAAGCRIVYASHNR